MGLFKKDEQLEKAKELIKQVNPKFSFIGMKPALKALPTYMDKGENIVYAASGALGSGVCIVIVTNKRVLILRKDPLATGGRAVDIPLSKVNDVSYKSGMALGKFYIADGSQKYKVKQLTADEAETLTESIKRAIEATTNQPNQASTIDAADEIAKFKKLADDGAITQEEFEAKKKQLLGL